MAVMLMWVGREWRGGGGGGGGGGRLEDLGSQTLFAPPLGARSPALGVKCTVDMLCVAVRCSELQRVAVRRGVLKSCEACADWSPMNC